MMVALLWVVQLVLNFQSSLPTVRTAELFNHFRQKYSEYYHLRMKQILPWSDTDKYKEEVVLFELGRLRW